MRIPSNYQKHTNGNILQRFLIENFYKVLLLIVADLKVEKVLDAGCGEGFTLARLKEAGIAKRLEGIDFSPAAIALGRKIHPSLALRRGDIYNLSYDNVFDLVVCNEVLEHLERPEKALREISRVAKRYCLLSVPNEPFFRIANLLRGKNLPSWGNDIGHINHWSSKSFARFVEEQGWKILDMKKPFPWIMALAEKSENKVGGRDYR